MGMDLRGAGGDFRWNYPYWLNLLQLAQEYGWEPAGTLPGPGCNEDDEEFAEEDVPDEQRCGYDTNDYQRVTAEDAKNLAAALERALPFIPDENKVAPYLEEVRLRGVGVIYGVNSEADLMLSNLDWFSGVQMKSEVEKFIRFCRAGSFWIG
jgi:hypothetical protein